MAFLDGAPPERLCQPMVDYFEARGGQLKMNARVKEIVLNEDGSVKHYELIGGEIVEGDLYMSAVPGGWEWAVWVTGRRACWFRSCERGARVGTRKTRGNRVRRQGRMEALLPAREEEVG